MDLQEKIAARKLERELYDKKNELENWKLHADSKNNNLPQADEGNEDIDKQIKNLDQELFNLKLQSAPGMQKAVYYIGIVASLLLIVFSIVSMFQGDWSGGAFLLAFALLMAFLSYNLINKRKVI